MGLYMITSVRVCVSSAAVNSLLLLWSWTLVQEWTLCMGEEESSSPTKSGKCCVQDTPNCICTVDIWIRALHKMSDLSHLI